MQYSKTGLEMRLVRLLIFFMAAFGGYTPLLLVAGFVFLVEEDDGLREDVLKAFFITISYSIIKLIVGYIPTIINWFVVLLSLNFESAGINRYFRIATEMLEFLRTVILLKLGLDAYRK